MDIPPDLELAIASHLDAERQLELAMKYMANAREMVLRESVRHDVTGQQLRAMFEQMIADTSAKQVHKLTTPI